MHASQVSRCHAASPSLPAAAVRCTVSSLYMAQAGLRTNARCLGTKAEKVYRIAGGCTCPRKKAFLLLPSCMLRKKKVCICRVLESLDVEELSRDKTSACMRRKFVSIR